MYIYNSRVSCISGEASISAVLSISWVSHIYGDLNMDTWICGYIDICIYISLLLLRLARVMLTDEVMKVVKFVASVSASSSRH